MHELASLDPGVEVVWRAFELRPEPVPPLDPDGAYLQDAWDRSVYPLAARLGVTMRRPPVQPRSRRAHETAAWARSQGRFDDCHRAIFRAFFERGEDIGDIAVLERIAAELAMDAGSLRRALETRAFEAAVVAEEREAGAMRLEGVPAFVADRKAAVTGVQPAETLRRLVAYAREQ